MLGLPLGRGDSEAPEERALGRRRHVEKVLMIGLVLFLNDLQGNFFLSLSLSLPHLGLCPGTQTSVEPLFSLMIMHSRCSINIYGMDDK